MRKLSEDFKKSIIDITTKYVNSNLTMNELAKEFNCGFTKIRHSIHSCIRVDVDLYERAMKKVAHLKTGGHKSIELSLNVFDSLKANKIKKKNLIDWWIANVEDNSLSVHQIILLANKSNIEVIS